MKDTKYLLTLILLFAVTFAIGAAVGFERGADTARQQIQELNK